MPNIVAVQGQKANAKAPLNGELTSITIALIAIAITLRYSVRDGAIMLQRRP
jgi:hypothetical protein